MTVIISSLIGAAGTVLSAWVGVLAVQTKRAVNGRVTELQRRVELLEELLRWTADRDVS